MPPVKASSVPMPGQSEHRVIASPEEKQIKNHEQSEEDRKVYEFANQLWEWSKQSRKEFDARWDEYLNFREGKQWKRRPPMYRAAPNINVIHSVCETIKPILTDTQPGFDVIPQQPEDYTFSDTLSSVQRDWWNRRGMDLTVSDLIDDALTYDAAYIKCIWNPELERNAGDSECYIPDPRNIWVNDGAIDFISGCQWVIERITKPVGQLRQMFPDKAHLIKPSGNKEPDRELMGRAMSGSVTLVSPVDRKAPSGIAKDMGFQSGGIDDYKNVEILEVWVTDDTVEEYQMTVKGKDGGEDQTVTETRRKYPNGRLITILPGCKVVLQDAESPYNDGRFPYVKYVANRKSRKFYGFGAVSPLIETQELLNKSAAVIVDYLNTMANPCWVVDANSGVDPEMLTNQIGLCVVKNPGTDVRREAAAPLPKEVFSMYQMWQQLADQISGINDVTQGRRPQGITAAEAIQTMQEAAQTRIRLMERNLQVALSRLGELVISRIMQFYSEPRVVRIAGDDTQWASFFEFYIETSPDGLYQMHRNDYTYDEQTKQYSPRGWKSVGRPTKGLFSVQVHGGTSLPYLRERRGELAMRLRQMQVIDDQELLESLDWPRREEIEKRMSEAKQQQAQAQAMAAAQKGK